MTKEFSLTELAEAWNQMHPKDAITPRTLRYYIGQGLLEGPGRVGPGRHYKEEHLERIEAIHLMQKNGETIDSIRSLLNELTADKISTVIKEQEKILLMREESQKRARGSAETNEDIDVKNVIAESQIQLSHSKKFMGISSLWKKKTQVNQVQSEPVLWRKVIVAPGLEVLLREDIAKRYGENLQNWIKDGSALMGTNYTEENPETEEIEGEED